MVRTYSKVEHGTCSSSLTVEGGSRSHKVSSNIKRQTDVNINKKFFVSLAYSVPLPLDKSICTYFEIICKNKL